MLLLLMLVILVAFKHGRDKQFNFHEFWGHYNQAYFELKCNQDYKQALTHFKWMEENATSQYPDQYDYLNEAICYVKLGDTTKATVCLRNAILHGFLKIDEDNGWARNQIGERSFTEVKKDLPKLKNEYYSRKASNLPYLLDEKKHSAIDQFVRSKAVTNILSEEDKTELVRVADSINISEFIASLKKGESPPTSSLIYHLYDSNEQYVPFIDSCLRIELFAGRVSPETYGFWVDRQLVFVDKQPQKYGTYISYGPSRVEGIANLDSVDYYRQQIGLPPLWQSAQAKSFALPPGYQKK